MRNIYFYLRLFSGFLFLGGLILVKAYDLTEYFYLLSVLGFLGYFIIDYYEEKMKKKIK